MSIGHSVTNQFNILGWAHFFQTAQGPLYPLSALGLDNLKAKGIIYTVHTVHIYVTECDVSGNYDLVW